MDSLKEKTALITGASSGVGRAIALEFAALGARVLLVARDRQKLRTVADEIQSAGGRAQSWPVDLTSDEAFQNFSSQIKREFIGLDFLVHSAGIFRMDPIASAPVTDFDALYRCNVRAPFVVTQAFLPLVMAQAGAIAFINSTAAEQTHANVSQYAATKSALKAIADTVRLEVKSHGVRVLSVMLGRTATPMQEEVCRCEGSVYDASRFLQPCDVARAVVNALTLSASAEVTNIYLRPAQAAPLVRAAPPTPLVIDKTGRWKQWPQTQPDWPVLVPRE